MGMGDQHLPRLTALLRRARRRDVVRRLADSTGISVLAMSAALGVSIGVHHWTGFESRPIALIAGFTTSAVLLIVNFNRRLDPLAAAITLDRCNHTHDLLSTAWATRRDERAWINSIRILAEDACYRIQLPAPVGRFAPRLHLAAWLGLGSVLLAGVLLSPEADAVRGDRASGRITTNTTPSDGQTIGAPLARSQDASTDTPLPADAALAQSGSSSQRPTGSGDDAPGTGRSSEGVAGKLPGGTDADSFTRLLPGTTPATGNGAAAIAHAAGAGARGTIADSTRSHVAPWSTDTWPASRDAALAQARTGQVPEAHRELVRQYFDR